MERYYSVKASVDDIGEAEGRLFDLTESLGTEFEQVDIYFRSNSGTLKMRNMPPSPEGQLISTQLIECHDNKRLIENTTTVIDNVDSLRETLCASLGIVDTVVKSRRVFLLPDARIYLDDVKRVGKYLEILVAVVPASPGAKETGEERACRRANEIAEALNIGKSESIPLSYIELMCPNDRLPQRS